MKRKGKGSTQAREALSEILGIRLTAGEKGLLRELARAAGLSPSELGRYAIQRLLALRDGLDQSDESP